MNLLVISLFILGIGAAAYFANRKKSPKPDTGTAPTVRRITTFGDTAAEAQTKLEDTKRALGIGSVVSQMTTFDPSSGQYVAVAEYLA